jgi:quinol monooxygenase YgiN
VIVITGFFEVAEGDRRAFLAAKAPQAAHSLEETGCQEYAFSTDHVHAGRVRLVERWDTMDDLAAHLAALRASGPTAAPVPVVATEFHVFEATPTQLPSA